MTPTHSVTFYIYNNHFNIILSMPRSPKWTLPLKFQSKILYVFLILYEFYLHAPCHPPWSKQPPQCNWRVELMKLLMTEFIIILVKYEDDYEWLLNNRMTISKFGKMWMFPCPILRYYLRIRLQKLRKTMQTSQSV